MVGNPRSSASAARWRGPTARLMIVAALLLAGVGALAPAIVCAGSPPARDAFVVLPAGAAWGGWMEDIATRDGRVPVAYPPDALLVQGGGDLLASLEARGAVVFTGVVPSRVAGTLSRPAQLAAAAWNRRLVAPALPGVTGRLEAGGEDALPPPTPPRKSGAPGQMAAPPGAGFYDTSEFLLGTVAVAVILPESDGTIDNNRENWTTQEIADVLAGVQSALLFHAAHDPSGGLAFVVVLYDSIATGYEPIRRGSWTTGEQSLWITDCMDSLGYTSGDIFQRTRAFDGALRDSLGTDWAITLFIVDSSQDMDGKFSDFTFAYAYLGGPFGVLTYDNGPWGIANMNAVSAHEILHTFYALDEYTGDPCTEVSGYLGFQNQNQQASCASDVLCLMRGDLTGAFAADSVCWYTDGQVGWTDTDSDSIPDILDTEPETVLDAFPDTSDTPTPTFTGTASVPALTNQNPKGTGNEITLARVAGVDYRIDGGAWSPAAPADGLWDEQTEAFTLTTATLTEEAHRIEVHARSTVGNVEASAAADTFVVRDVTPPLPVVAFSATPRDTTVRLRWTNPATSDFAATRIVFRTDAYPTGPSDGALLGVFPNASGSADSALHSGVIPDTLYYYAAFAQDEVPNAAAAATLLAAPLDPVPPAALHAPVTNALYVSVTPAFRWAPSVPEPGDTVVAYWIQVATDSLFASPLVDLEAVTGAPADTTWSLGTPLPEGTRCFARLRAKDASSGTYGFYSPAFPFTTELPVDSIAWRPESVSGWTNFASAETLAASASAQIEVAFCPADSLGVGGHAGRVVFTTDGGASWDSVALAWDHAAADTGFFRGTLAFGTNFKRHDLVGFRVEGWDPTTAGSPRVDDGGYTFVGGPNPLAAFHVPSLAVPGPETMRDPLIGNLLDTLFTFEIAAPAGTLLGGAVRLRSAAGGPYTGIPAAYLTTSGGDDYFRAELDTTFLAEDSLAYYLVGWGGADFDTTFVSGSDDSSIVSLTAAEAEATPFFFRVGTLTAVSSVGGEGRRFRLEQNAPNPFNPRTRIAFDVGDRPVRARLAVYDASGRLVHVLADGELAAGRHEVGWDGSGDGGAPLPSGVYLYRLDAGGATEVRRMTLLK